MVHSTGLIRTVHCVFDSWVFRVQYSALRRNSLSYLLLVKTEFWIVSNLIVYKYLWTRGLHCIVCGYLSWKSLLRSVAFWDLLIRLCQFTFLSFNIFYHIPLKWMRLEYNAHYLTTFLFPFQFIFYFFFFFEFILMF